MTIQFNCPKCDAVIGFQDKHKGRHAHCTNCGQHFIIPSHNLVKAKKVKLPNNEIAVPIPGFYRAVFINSRKLFTFTSMENITSLVFIAILVCLNFFISEMNYSFEITGRSLTFTLYFPLGWIVWGTSWGLLFWYYMDMIQSTAFDKDELPEVILGGTFGIYDCIWKIVQSLYTIFVILLVVGLPYLIAALVLWKTGIECPVLLYILMFGGFLMSPMAILNAAIGRDLTLLRHDYLVIPIFRAFWPYMITVLLLGAAVFLQMRASQFTHQKPAAAAGQLALNLAAQFFMLVAMRSIGLFHRHYSCHLPW